jgi:hypothetical protein
LSTCTEKEEEEIGKVEAKIRILQGEIGLLFQQQQDNQEESIQSKLHSLRYTACKTEKVQLRNNMLNIMRSRLAGTPNQLHLYARKGMPHPTPGACPDTKTASQMINLMNSLT